MTAPDPPVGREFAEAFAAKDFTRAADLLHPQVDFRALTPRRFWEATSATAVMAEILPVWLNADDHIDEVLAIETEAFADRERASWRLRGHNAHGPFVVEQQAYYAAEDGRIVWMRVLCSGFRPA